MPFNRRDKSHQDIPMYDVMTDAELDPGLVKPEDFVIEGQDAARLRRILKYTDQAGKAPLGQPTPDINRARPRKAKSKSKS